MNDWTANEWINCGLLSMRQQTPGYPTMTNTHTHTHIQTDIEPHTGSHTDRQAHRSTPRVSNVRGRERGCRLFFDESRRQRAKSSQQSFRLTLRGRIRRSKSGPIGDIFAHAGNSNQEATASDDHRRWYAGRLRHGNHSTKQLD